MYLLCRCHWYLPALVYWPLLSLFVYSSSTLSFSFSPPLFECHVNCSHDLSLVPLFFSSFFLFFIRFNHTPVIMASGRELCYVLLSGVCLCYVMTFIILARPTVIRCTLLRIGLGLGLSLCYSAIFVKTNRISRIFNCGVKAVSRPIYTSPISQIAICLCTYSISGSQRIDCIPGHFGFSDVFSLFFFLFQYKMPSGLSMWITDFFLSSFFFFDNFICTIRYCIGAAGWNRRLVSIWNPGRKGNSSATINRCVDV